MKTAINFVRPLVFTALGAAAMLLWVGCAPRQSDTRTSDTVERSVLLKVASFYPLNLPILGPNLQRLAERVEAASGGTVKLKPFDPGKLVGPMEILDAVSSGKIEAGYASAGFWRGKMPAAPIFSAVPFGPEASEYIAWFFAGNGMRLYQEMYDRHGYHVKVLVCAMMSPETSGWFTREIKTTDDLQGLKIRFFGLGGDVMQKLGASVNILPAGEIFTALEKGLIDATEYSMPVIDEKLGLYKLAKFNYYPGWHQQTTAIELLINKDVWNNLSLQQKTVIEMACRERIVYSLAEAEASQAEVMDRNAGERGVANMTWPPELLDAFKQTWLEVAAEHSEEDEFFREVWEDFSAFREQYSIWGSKAFLHRDTVGELMAKEQPELSP